MFGDFIFLAFFLAFGGTVVNDCKSQNLDTKQCVDYVKSTAVYEYPTSKK